MRGGGGMSVMANRARWSTPRVQSEVGIHNPPMPEPPCCNICSFYKTPTSFDTSAPGGLRKNTHLSVLATSHHAITAGTLFTVIYKPSFWSDEGVMERYRVND
ncbi:hypothetical protein Tco_0872830 [Tanacetum coccineum]